MTLIPWKNKRGDGSELAPLDSFRQEMDRLLDTFVREPFGLSTRSGWMDMNPPIDVEETEHEIIVHAESPGMSADDFDVSVSGSHLVIAGEKKESKEQKGPGFVRQERRFGSFRREIPLPTSVNHKDVSAEYINGVLTVHLKKTAAAATKKIQVTSK